LNFIRKSLGAAATLQSDSNCLYARTKATNPIAHMSIERKAPLSRMSKVLAKEHGRRENRIATGASTKAVNAIWSIIPAPIRKRTVNCPGVVSSG
jgi:hypothetical protein